jgi:hypothetical protein
LCRVREHGAIWDVSSRSARVRLTKPFILGSVFKLIRYRLLTSWNKRGTLFFLCSREEAGMLKTFVEEAAALASIVLFVGMIAVWAQLIPQL